MTQMVKNLPAVQETSGLTPGSGKPTPVFFPGEFHGQGSLGAYSPQSHNALHTTEATNPLTQVEDAAVTPVYNRREKWRHKEGKQGLPWQSSG